jgi:hypothetical protein
MSLAELTASRRRAASGQRITSLHHVNVNAGWKDIEEGKVSDFDPDEVKRRGAAAVVDL